MADVTDADGYKTTYSYDDPTGTVTQTVTVVNLTTGATVTTSSVPDLLGRPVQTTDGDGEITNVQYVDGLLQSTVTTTPEGGPTQMVVNNTGQGTVTTLATVPNGSMQAVSETWLDYAGRTVQTETYDGPVDTSTTEAMYDDSGQLYWSEDAEGTVTITDYDGLGRVASTWTGTDGTDCGGGQTPVSNSDGTDMVEISADVYDNGGVGDGNLTETVDFPAGANYSPDDPPAPDALSVTQMFYDWQDRLIATKSGALVGEGCPLPADQSGFQVDGVYQWLVLDPAGEGTGGDSTQRPITYNTLDNLGEVTYEYVYDGNGVSIACGAGVSPAPPAANLLRAETTNSYNAQGQEYQSVVHSVNQTNGAVDSGVSPEVTSSIYDCDGDVISTTDPRNNTTTDAYDGLGNLVSTTDADNGTTSYTFDADGNQLTETDPMGDTTTNKYNRLDQLVSTTDATGATTGYTYDAAGNQATETDPLGNTTTDAYDDIGQLVSTTDANGATTSYTYYANGDQHTETDPDGNVTYDIYNHLDQLVSTTDGNGATTSYKYDADGDQLTETDPLGSVTTNTYNDLDQLVHTTDANGDTTRYTYDAAGNQLSSTDALDNTTSYAYNSFGNQVSETDPDGNKTSYSYDPDGNKTGETVTAPGGAVIGTSSWQYDADGNCTQYTDADNRTTTYKYNLDDQLTGEKWYNAQGSVVNVVAYAYNSLGDLTSESDDFSSYTYQYDSLGRQTSVTSDNPGQPTVVLTNGYDATGSDAKGDDLRTSLSATINGTPDFLNTYSYDSDGNLKQVVQQGQSGGNGVTQKKVNFGYNDDNQLTSINRYQGAGANLVASSTYTFDDRGDLTALTHDGQGESTLAAYTWDYNSLGEVTQETSTADAESKGTPASVNYSYDTTGQLRGAQYTNFANAPSNESYSFDANGNQTSNGQQVGTDNQLQSDGTFTYSYDAEGNCTTRTRISSSPAADFTTTYTWDNRNRLTEVTYTNNSGQITSQVQYTYDVENRWIGDTVTTYSTPGNLSTGSTTQQQFVYDGNQIVLSFSGSTNSTLTNRYLWGPAVDQLLVQESPGSLQGGVLQAGAVDWALTDNLGTVRGLVVYSGGVTSIVMQAVYTSFGNPVSQINPSTGQAATVDCLFAFAGRPYDRADGLENNDDRWYEPSTQRWFGPDPSGLGPDPNPYRYCGNDATNETDPSGLADQVGGSVSVAQLKLDWYYSQSHGCADCHVPGQLFAYQTLINIGDTSPGQRIAIGTWMGGASNSQIQSDGLAAGWTTGTIYGTTAVVTVPLALSATGPAAPYILAFSIGYGIGSSAATRANDNQSTSQIVGGTIADNVGASAIFAAITNCDIATQRNLNLSPFQRAFLDRLGSRRRSALDGSLAAGRRRVIIGSRRQAKAALYSVLMGRSEIRPSPARLTI